MAVLMAAGVPVVSQVLVDISLLAVVHASPGALASPELNPACAPASASASVQLQGSSHCVFR